MYFIEVVCISWFFCKEPPYDYSRYYETADKCDRALVELAKAWKPTTGAYRFNCRRLTGGDKGPDGNRGA